MTKKRGQQRALAKKCKISAAYLCDVVNYRRNPGDAILKRLGLRRTKRIVYEYFPVQEKP